jgi:hypothetical protein
LGGTVSARAPCQPAPSRTSTAWTFSGRLAANSARNRLMVVVVACGKTRATSTPVAGSTAAKM